MLIKFIRYLIKVHLQIKVLLTLIVRTLKPEVLKVWLPMNWKKKINTVTDWSFEGSKNQDGSLLRWSFVNSYQMLIYYRS
jgi:hypothetical protein